MTPEGAHLLEVLAALRDVHVATLAELDPDGEMASDERFTILALRTQARARMESYATAIRWVRLAIPRIEAEAVEAAMTVTA
jgi:hypothetical protein